MSYLPLDLLLAASVAALTEPQVDQIIEIIEASIKAFGEGIRTVWVALSPIGIGYLMWKQAQNRKALDANTTLTGETKDEATNSRKEVKQALDVSNGHNDKIVKAVEISERVLAKLDAEPKTANAPEHPVPVKEP